MAGLYIHIPFCASKCIYCDFYSLAGSSHDTGQYVDALVAELKLRHRELAEPLAAKGYKGFKHHPFKKLIMKRLYHRIASGRRGSARIARHVC